MLKIFIGYDPAETIAYHVLSHSILRQASGPISITPVNKSNLPMLTRPKQDGSTEFSFSRFLVPYLSDFTGWSIFMDSDMLVMCDIYELVQHMDHSKAVCVVKHDYKTKHATKFLNNKNEDYPCKNWSSLMLFNNKKCDGLTPYIVNEESGKHLHRFEWCGLDKVGEVPKEFNHLVGEYKENKKAKIAHYTLGAPCFEEYAECEFSKEWFQEKEKMLHADKRELPKRARRAARES